MLLLNRRAGEQTVLSHRDTGDLFATLTVIEEYPDSTLLGFSLCEEIEIVNSSDTFQLVRHRGEQVDLRYIATQRVMATITILSIGPGGVRLGFDAPSYVKILRDNVKAREQKVV